MFLYDALVRSYFVVGVDLEGLRQHCKVGSCHRNACWVLLGHGVQSLQYPFVLGNYFAKIGLSLDLLNVSLHDSFNLFPPLGHLIGRFDLSGGAEVDPLLDLIPLALAKVEDGHEELRYLDGCPLSWYLDLVRGKYLLLSLLVQFIDVVEDLVQDVGDLVVALELRPVVELAVLQDHFDFFAGYFVLLH